MGVTIKDIAKLAKVSHTTVSRALNDSPLINESTKERIRKIAKQLNYTPNVSARSLVLHRSYNIGLFFSTLDTGTSAGFLYEAVRGVNSRIKERYNLIVKGIDDYRDYHSISERSFDGIIVMSQTPKDNAFIEAILEKNIPQVVLNRQVEYPGVCNILSDDYTGAYHIVEYMIQQGHQHIAIIEGKTDFQSAVERRKGYIDAMGHHQLPIRPDYQIQGNYTLEGGYQAMKKLLELDRRPTSVFCSNDDTAVGAIKALLEAGLAIPHDMSVAGFDDSLFSSYLSPALTTVKRPIETISQTAADKMMEMVEGSDNPPLDRIYLKTKLMIRESVASPVQM